ncbi:MAG: S49 family peptidase [Gammaproteobacteria bacterium]|jgi:protease-4|nr:S49 family peptidase [Gammaproteobacteria bacterium]MBT3488242.1 S49 family peptidase [Gammaproteobacteria bacterium]MBT4549442.1 S49 family peptidase [Gammaproteobacteria bacterium]MBT7141005.1 S49 family peptidase [Gammaproteobacteria bacterium]MBT7328024.1 S49 family peptidase [Gammaproteobacteria bacterium]
MHHYQSHELESAVSELKREIRRGRWFKNTLFLLLISYLLLIIFASIGVIDEIDPGERIAAIKLHGAISSETMNSAEILVPAIRKAAKDERVKHLLLQLNSPGGTPAQAERIWQTLRKVKKDHPDKKIFVSVDELCASACYYIASAADEIHATEVSLIGSIGVRMGGFGFVGTMEQYGVEQRELTAGEFKALLDPFSPRNPEAEQFLKEHVLTITHNIFIDRVKSGRGERLNQESELFNGLIWVGQEAKPLGLIDGFQSPQQIADSVGVESIVDYTPKVDLFEQYANQFAASLSSAWRGIHHSSALEM